jgi:hypothetical protein
VNTPTADIDLSPGHDPMVCGLFADLCPGCAWEDAHGLGEPEELAADQPADEGQEG